MLCGGSFREALAGCLDGSDHLDWKRGEVVPRWVFTKLETKPGTKLVTTPGTKPGNKPFKVGQFWGGGDGWGARRLHGSVLGP